MASKFRSSFPSEIPMHLLPPSNTISSCMASKWLLFLWVHQDLHWNSKLAAPMPILLELLPCFQSQLTPKLTQSMWATLLTFLPLLTCKQEATFTMLSSEDFFLWPLPQTSPVVMLVCSAFQDLSSTIMLKDFNTTLSGMDSALTSYSAQALLWFNILASTMFSLLAHSAQTVLDIP